MATASYKNSLGRQWELLQLLPSRAPGATAGELCKKLNESGHEVSKRTVERDLIQLSQIFPLECNDKGAPFGWFWMQGHSIDLPGIALSEALTLRIVEDHIRPLVPAPMLKGLESRFTQARKKLQAAQSENPSADWLSKVASVHPDMPLLPPSIAPSILESVQHALLKDLQIHCRYYSAHSDWTIDHVLNPLGLVLRGQITYLVATADPHHDIRLFALHRMRSVELTEQFASIPQDFKLTSYVESGALSFGAPEPIQLKAWASTELVRLLRETPLSEDMALQVTEDGYTLTATVQDTWQLRWWALSHAGSLVVLEPAEIRSELLERLERATDLYGRRH